MLAGHWGLEGGVAIRFVFPRINPVAKLPSGVMTVALLTAMAIRPKTTAISIPDIRKVGATALAVTFVSISPFLLGGCLTLGGKLRISEMLVLG